MNWYHQQKDSNISAQQSAKQSLVKASNMSRKKKTSKKHSPIKNVVNNKTAEFKGTKICIHTWTHTHKHKHTQTHTHTHTYIYICIYIYIYIYACNCYFVFEQIRMNGS